MRLSLVIKSYKGSPPTSGGRHAIPPTGGTIGRSHENDVVLPDPERFVSGVHARVRAHEGEFYLDDLSRNGVFLNGGSAPLGRARSERLKAGDTITIGEYEIAVEIEGDVAPVPPAPRAPSAPPPFDPVPPQDTGRPSEAVASSPVDPLELLGGASRPAPSSPAGSQSDHVPPESLHFEPPRAVVDPSVSRPPGPPAPPTSGGGGIPEDWDLTGRAEAPVPPPPSPSAPSAPAPSASKPPEDPSAIPEDWDLTGRAPVDPAPAPTPPEARSEGLPAAHEDPPRPPAPPEPTRGETPVLPPDWDDGEQVPPPPSAPEAAARESDPPSDTGDPGQSPASPPTDAFSQRMLASAGVSPSGPPAADLAEASGRLLAEMASGLVQLLAARSSFKGGLRMEATGIRPVENNPFKFGTDGAEVLGHLLFPTGAGFASADQAVAEAVTDLKDHQVATIAAMRAALDGLLRRLDPDTLEAQCDQEGRSRLGLSGKGRYWDAYRELMSRLRTDPEAFFKEMFAEEFVRAYEEQIELLSKDRR